MTPNKPTKYMYTINARTVTQKNPRTPMEFCYLREKTTGLFDTAINKTIKTKLFHFQMGYEPPHEKTNLLHMRKQRCRSASR